MEDENLVEVAKEGFVGVVVVWRWISPAVSGLSLVA